MKSKLINVRPDARVKSNGCHGTLEREEWRDVVGYEGYYQVSSFGRVRSLDRMVKHPNGGLRKLKGRIISPSIRNHYPSIMIGANGVRIHKNIHRLVADAFIPNPDNLPQVNHRNEDKTCNIPDNLEWCDSKYNMNYGNRSAKCSKALKGRVFTDETKIRMTNAKRDKMTPVLQYTLDGEFVAEYESQRAAARASGVRQSGIQHCLQKEGRTSGGFIWKFKE